MSQPPNANIGFNDVSADGTFYCDAFQPYTSGGDVTIPSTTILVGKRKYVALPSTGTTNISASQSGSIFTMQQATANTTINLPSPASGLYYKFLVIATSDGSHTQAITATGAILKGSIIGPGGADTDNLLLTGSTVLTLSATAVNVKAGDFLELDSDGTSWFVNGRSSGTAVGWSAS